MTTPQVAVTLKPCGHCGKSDISVQDKGLAGEEDWCRVYAGVCSDCGAASGWYPTEAEAITAWNTRAHTEEVARALLGEAYETLSRIRQCSEDAMAVHAALETIEKIDTALGGNQDDAG